jgi:hypothetical protein
MTGTCKPKKEEKRSSEPLAPEQVSGKQNRWHLTTFDNIDPYLATFSHI